VYGNDSDLWRKYYGEAKANWTRSFDLHDVGALLYYYMEDVQDTRWGFGNLGINAIPARRQNVSGRLSYGYNNAYFVDWNFGYTGSSQFQKRAALRVLPLARPWVGTYLVSMGAE